MHIPRTKGSANFESLQICHKPQASDKRRLAFQYCFAVRKVGFKLERSRPLDNTSSTCLSLNSLALFLTPCEWATQTQLFSDPGKKREPFFGKTILVGKIPKKKGKKGATDQLSFYRHVNGTHKCRGSCASNRVLQGFQHPHSVLLRQAKTCRVATDGTCQ